MGLTIHGISQTEYIHVDPYKDWPVLEKNISYALAVVHRFAQLYAQGIEFDVVHAPNWDAEAVAIIRAKVYPVVLEVVTSLAKVINTEKLSYNEDLQFSLELDRWQIGQADVVTVPSRGICTSYETLMGIPHEETNRWEVVPLGITPTGVDLKQQPNGLKRLLFVGRLERRKGIHTLLEVLPDLLAKFQDWECHLVGDDQIFLNEGGTYKSRFMDQYAGAAWLIASFFMGKYRNKNYTSIISNVICLLPLRYKNRLG